MNKEPEGIRRTKASHARSAGKSEVRSRTLWTLEVRGVGFRFVVETDAGVLQRRVAGKWSAIRSVPKSANVDIAMLSATVDTLLRIARQVALPSADADHEETESTHGPSTAT